ncbi:MAG TPA: zf-HC2 domain-containing protein [Polyangiales bacterium]
MKPQTRPTDCVSNLLFDEWLAGELEPSAQVAVEAHARGCERCTTRSAELIAQRQAFLQQAPDFAAHARLVPQHRAMRSAAASRAASWIAGGVIALAACALLMLRPHAHPQLSSDAGTRSKGGARLGFFVKRGENVRRGAPGDTVHPGDRLRFTYASPSPVYFALLNSDAKASSVFFPGGAAQAARLPAGTETPLDFSVELDGVLGVEQIYAVFCPAPFEVASARAAITAHTPAALPPDCHVETVTLHKEPAH